MLEVKAAYGREYKTQAEIKKDWNDNKDFQIFNGPYVNKQDIERYSPNESVVVRYGKNFEKVVGV